jgi:hypothetical protein
VPPRRHHHPPPTPAPPHPHRHRLHRPHRLLSATIATHARTAPPPPPHALTATA